MSNESNTCPKYATSMKCQFCLAILPSADELQLHQYGSCPAIENAHEHIPNPSTKNVTVSWRNDRDTNVGFVNVLLSDVDSQIQLSRNHDSDVFSSEPVALLLGNYSGQVVIGDELHSLKGLCIEEDTSHVDVEIGSNEEHLDQPSTSESLRQLAVFMEPPRCVNISPSSLDQMGFNSLKEWVRDPQNLYIGRRKSDVPGSKWGNPYYVHDHGRKRAIQKYEERLRSSSVLMRSIIELRGKTLGCSCKPLPCHGDVLVKVFKEIYLDNPSPLSSLQPPPLVLDKSNLHEGDKVTLIIIDFCI